jgi:copper(I)-binding protein
MQNPLTPSPRTANRVLHLGIAIISAHSDGGEAVKISDAWVHAAAQVGGDVALSMTIKNEAYVADALLRVITSCCCRLGTRSPQARDSTATSFFRRPER